MAIINTTFGFVFVHVPKSAGTSVTTLLSQLSTPLDIEVGGSAFGEDVQNAYKKRHGLSKHSSATEIRALLGEQAWKRMTSFGVVRHPLERLASAYRFLKKWDSPQNKFHEAANAFSSFGEFVDSGVWIEDDGPDRMFRPQAFWLADGNARLQVDRICRVEHLESDLLRLLSDIGVPASKLPGGVPKLNTTDDARDSSAGLGAQAVKKIEKKYLKDYELFGYGLQTGV